jgi:hypothetical protein
MQAYTKGPLRIASYRAISLANSWVLSKADRYGALLRGPVLPPHAQEHGRGRRGSRLPRAGHIAQGIIHGHGDLKPADIFVTQRAAAQRSDRPEYLQHPLFGWRRSSDREFPKDLGAGRRPATRHRAIRREPENSMRHGVCGP